MFTRFVLCDNAVDLEATYAPHSCTLTSCPRHTFAYSKDRDQIDLLRAVIFSSLTDANHIISLSQHVLSSSHELVRERDVSSHGRSFQIRPVY